jgi:methyl-accepting chemotaxis protein
VVARVSVHMQASRESAALLDEASVALGESAQVQFESTARQAAALRQCEATAQEVKQTAVLALSRAASIGRSVEKAEDVARAGQDLLARNASGMTAVGETVRELTARIGTVSDYTRKIESIAGTVRDIAEQSNMLALNAAIEAVRAGESGRGFAIVAREIRQLADQSSRATQSVRNIAQQAAAAIEELVKRGHESGQRVNGLVGEAHATATQLGSLLELVRSNSGDVRQISAAVSQQSAGIEELFAALQEISGLAEGSVATAARTSTAATTVRLAGTRLAEIVRERVETRA